MGPLLLSAPLPEQELGLLIDPSVCELAVALAVFAAVQAALWRYAHKVTVRLLPLWCLLLTAVAAFMLCISSRPYDGLILIICMFYALPCEAAGLLCGVLWRKIAFEHKKGPPDSDL